MPAAWIGAGAAVLGAVNSSKGSGSPTTAFSGPNTNLANSGWASGFNGLENVANTGYDASAPLYAQSLAQQQGINYSPYLNAANQAGQQYGNMAGVAQNQANTYGAAGNALYQAAFNPNQAQYNMNANQLTVVWAIRQLGGRN